MLRRGRGRFVIAAGTPGRFVFDESFLALTKAMRLTSFLSAGTWPEKSAQPLTLLDESFKRGFKLAAQLKEPDIYIFDIQQRNGPQHFIAGIIIVDSECLGRQFIFP